MNPINIMAPINPLGYGVVGLNVVKQLNKNGLVSLFPIGNVEVTNQHDADIVKECIENQLYFNAKNPCLRVWHQFSMAEQIGNGLRTGFPIFELDWFSHQENVHLNSLEKIFVCSQWAKEVVVNMVGDRFVNDCHVAPLGVDRFIFFEQNIEPWGETRFINTGKWEVRKGHDVLIEAFEKAFEPEDNVKLIMMNHNPFLNEEQTREWVDMYKNSKVGDKIEFVPRVSTHEEVAHVMRQTDCGVFPSRAEGWNLEAIEMMSCGKQVIITDYSAHTEFCNEENSLLVNIDNKEDAYDGIWFHGQGRWAEIAEPQVEQIVEHMRAVHKEKQETGKIRNAAGVQTATDFSWENTCNSILAGLSS